MTTATKRPAKRTKPTAARKRKAVTAPYVRVYKDAALQPERRRAGYALCASALDRIAARCEQAHSDIDGAQEYRLPVCMELRIKREREGNWHGVAV